MILQLCKNYSKQEVNQEQVPMNLHSQNTILLKFLGLDGMIRRYDLCMQEGKASVGAPNVS